jgi:predicted TIM-barrel fold metal-dependent hydrolase
MNSFTQLKEVNMIIEWNAHMFSSDYSRYPFHPQAAYKPAPANCLKDPLAEYIKRMEREGIDKAVLVQPEPYGDDHRLVLDCLQKDREHFWATSLFYPKDGDAPQRLTELVQKEPQIVATRFHGHRGKETYLNTFLDPGVLQLWETAGKLGLVIELHIGPNYGKQVAEVLTIYPQYPVLIDHLAEPYMGNAVEFANILSLASFDNVYMKLSGLADFSKDEPLFLEAKPFTRLVLNAFGPDRLVWSGGSPQIVDAHFDDLPENERNKIKGGNLVKLLKI